MPLVNHRENSRINWSRNVDSDVNPNFDDIKLGCLLRIADATEVMAKRHTDLIDECQRHKQRADSAYSRVIQLEHQIRGTRGALTRAQRKSQASDLGASLEMRAAAWLLSGDTGTSSETICAAMLGIEIDRGHRSLPDVPRDMGDFGRCHRLLAAFPEWRSRLSEVAIQHAQWRRLVAAWDELTRLYETGDHDKCRALLREAIAP